MKITHLTLSVAIACTLGACGVQQDMPDKAPIDYVDPYIGNISHLLDPTFPTIQLPNSMLRVYPERADYTSELLNGLPIIVTNHRERSAFNLSPYQGDSLRPVMAYTYDNERLTPYSYSVELDDNRIKAEYALSHQSAQYRITFEPDKPAYVIVNSRNGAIRVGHNFICGQQQLSNNTNIYLYIEPQEEAIEAGVVENGVINGSKDLAEGTNVCAAWRFAEGTYTVNLRYGISFISEEQAEKNLRREQKAYNLEKLAQTGRDIWNETLERIQVEGGTEDERTIFYSSFYRTFERPVCMSEDGRYFSAFDGQVHNDNGTPFYTDDWIWDTYRAAHPLRVLIDRQKEENIIDSYLRMAEQMGNLWMPTFPETTGDTRRMNSNHAVATVADALVKGLHVDTVKAYEACRRGMEEKTLAPWSGKTASWIDTFYSDHGYIPALRPDESETDPNVHPFEKRQPVAVTLGTSYDQWCLSRIAETLGKKDEAAHYLQCSYNYRNIFNEATGFFHPKDKNKLYRHVHKANVNNHKFPL